MITLGPSTTASLSNATEHDLAPPLWVERLVGDVGVEAQQRIADDTSATIRRGDGATLVSARFAGAADAPAAELEARTIAIYDFIRQTLNSSSSSHAWPARVWNYIPHIHQPLDDATGRDRYMVFNSGRFRAYGEWFGGRENFLGHVPTASGIGHRGRDLVIHCLAVDKPGRSIENPRQIPAFGYSARYGPQPPCFARGTLAMLGDETSLLIGGTASICGETSAHVGSLEKQADETLANIVALVRSAWPTLPASDEAAALAALRTLRVYHPNDADRRWIESNVSKRFASAESIELIRADLCRAELLIEIEGVARL